ncbi:ABC transporter permease [Roseivirga sp. E12]|uniref:ABC transporter permease n=1 Tax=Roseivirga sp. E12 TaxID=2819237 RepID=UPI001ABC6BE1|nr:ABC transporter permease [Roseivirga sp. E12]MBO3697455.1 ABC transporter permease [Roseivirga sp. E12]
MFKNYLVIALRNIRRNKLYASLNILGLAIGLGSFFIIYLFIQNELAYDQFHAKGDRVFRALQIDTRDTGEEKLGGLTSALAPAAALEIPEIIAFSRLENFPKAVLIMGIADSVDRVNSAAVDAGFLEFFDIEILAGSQEKSFQTPNSTLMAESKAVRYFGDINSAIGKPIKIGRAELIIQAVFKDIPNTSSIKAEVISPITTINSWRGENGFNQWNASYSDQTYFLLAENADPDLVLEKLNTLFEKNAISENRSLGLQALSDIHFSLDVSGPVSEKTDRQYILIFSLVAGFILICSVFNYISLALSQSVERTKEIGVRRVVGAGRKSLYGQFMAESVTLVFLSFVLAVVLVELLMPQLEAVLDRALDVSILKEPRLLLQGLLFSIAVALLCSVYPAYLSTRMHLVKIFRNASGTFSQKRLIAGLSVFQITVFVVLISVAFTADRQMSFMREENLGFDSESQLVLNRFSRTATSKKVAIKNDLKNLSGVVSATYATSIPTRTLGTSTFGEFNFRWNNFDIDEDYFETLGMSLVAGRGFLPEDTDSSKVIIINETAARKLGFEGDAVGKSIERNPKEHLRIVGVVEDFHFQSKKEPIEATLFEPITEYSSVLVLKLNQQNLSATVDEIKETYSSITGGDEANYFFLNDQVNSQYKQETVMIKMINTFVLIAALVAFIGLFGISGYSAKRRLKEMGIRKVLGASFMAIQVSLNRSSLGRLVLAIMISMPLVVYWMEDWLSTFAYRIELPYLLIVGAVLLASFVMIVTVSFHSIRTFFVNPVEILKDE